MYSYMISNTVQRKDVNDEGNRNSKAMQCVYQYFKTLRRMGSCSGDTQIREWIP